MKWSWDHHSHELPISMLPDDGARCWNQLKSSFGSFKHTFYFTLWAYSDNTNEIPINHPSGCTGVCVCVCVRVCTILRVEVEEKKKMSWLMKDAWGTSQSSLTEIVVSLIEQMPWDDCRETEDQHRYCTHPVATPVESNKHLFYQDHTLVQLLVFKARGEKKRVSVSASVGADVPAGRPPAAACVCKARASLAARCQPPWPETCWGQSLTPADREDTGRLDPFRAIHTFPVTSGAEPRMHMFTLYV